jgi:hypothetical protein
MVTRERGRTSQADVQALRLAGYDDATADRDASAVDFPVVEPRRAA